ncbi:hypothetical protein SAMN05216481_11088 [Streptomyces radiopugnans]|uniref:Uncharacterized protein n=1 Tax=Streptomyces radiopugnans TaxID=403935 RepID=A0A1H9H3K9_9ACTN|nr:hypothetical protein SAMN05216481_11088 [Streptomyces radiopugnans]
MGADADTGAGPGAGGTEPPDDRPEPSEPSEPEASRRPGIPNWSAASCNHSGGVSRNEVASRSTRRGGAAGTGAADAPYSSSYRRITSPTGKAGHSVDSPLSRAITSRCRPPPDDGPSEPGAPPGLPEPRGPSAHATKPRSNSRTRTSRC